ERSPELNASAATTSRLSGRVIERLSRQVIKETRIRNAAAMKIIWRRKDRTGAMTRDAGTSMTATQGVVGPCRATTNRDPDPAAWYSTAGAPERTCMGGPGTL